MSKKHCQIVCNAIGYFIKDEKSLNGSFLAIDNQYGFYPQNYSKIKINSIELTILIDKKKPNIIKFKFNDFENEIKLLKEEEIFFTIKKNEIVEAKGDSKHFYIKMEKNEKILIKPLISHM